MEYEDAVRELLAIPRYKKKTDQREIACLLAQLGSPQQRLRLLHVAGTNGKGSVCAYLERIGRSLGYSMGLFTSPHLLDIRERFQIDAEWIAKAEFTDCYVRVRQAAQGLEADGHPPFTFFEVIFSMALCYFAAHPVDYVIIEAGMGGGSDSTNVVHPVISILTAVGLDHTAVLGDTLAQIAREKAGIFKTGVPAVSSRQDPEVRAILCQKAREIDTPCHFTDEYGVRILKNTPQGIDFWLESEYDRKRFYTRMCGAYQVENAATAIMAAQLLWKPGFAALQAPVADAFWAGRMECVAPRCYVDGAHNPQAMRQFVRTVQNCFSESPKLIVYAVASDKDDAGMLRELLHCKAHTLLITELANHRKTACDQVAQLASELVRERGDAVSILAEPDIERAVAYAFSLQTEQDYLFCTGSLYLVSAVKEWIRRFLDD